MVTISADIGEIDIHLNAYRLGEIFAAMDSQEQMRFLNGLASDTLGKGTWWPFQCREIANEFDIAKFYVMKRQVIDCLKTLIEHLEDENDDK